MFIHKWNEPYLPLLLKPQNITALWPVLIFRPAEGLSWPEWLATTPMWLTHPQTLTVTHPGTNRARRKATSLIETSALPLSQAATLIVRLSNTIPTPAGITLRIKSMQYKYNTNQWGGNRCLLC